MKDLYWLASLLEGEGSFYCKDNGTAQQIVVQMRDYDIIYRIACMWNTNVQFVKRQKSYYSDQYRTVICGVRAIQWIMTLYSLMGEVKREKIKEIIELWKCNGFEINNKLQYCKRGHRLTPENRYNNGNCKKCEYVTYRKRLEKSNVS